MQNIYRHHSQKFDINADLIFTKMVSLDGYDAQPGDDVPKAVCSGHRSRIWWKSGVVALKHWNYETQQPIDPDEPKDLGGGWYLFPDGEKVHGNKALAAKLASLEVEIA